MLRNLRKPDRIGGKVVSCAMWESIAASCSKVINVFLLYLLQHPRHEELLLATEYTNFRLTSNVTFLERFSLTGFTGYGPNEKRAARQRGRKKGAHRRQPVHC